MARHSCPGRIRIDFILTAQGVSQDAEIERAIALGASRVGVDERESIVMADPDGNEFRILAKR
nr:VOC family protein [Renibacterium salmoninarum]